MGSSINSLLARLRGYTPLRQSDGRRPYWILLLVPALALFLYAPWAGSGSYTSLSGDGWDVIAQHRTGERLSRGALRQQGARAHIRENLRDEYDYIFTTVGAGWNNQVFQIASCEYEGMVLLSQFYRLILYY